MQESDSGHISPQWGPTTKLVAGLTIVALISALLVRFNNIIGPLILTFMLSYILHPIAVSLSKSTRLSWRASVNLIFLILIILIIGFFTITGVTLIQQLQRLITLVSTFLTDLPSIIETLSSSIYTIPSIGPFGPWEIDVAQVLGNLNIDFIAVSQQILGVLQPMIGQAGGVLGSLASSAAATIGWGVFILIISYFILADAGRVPDLFDDVDLPGYVEDFRRLGRELGRIWNAFLRGQLIIFALIIVSNFILMSILGIRTALGLAFLAGIAKFIPYIGPLIAGIVTAVVALLQPFNYLGFEPLVYAIIVVIAAIVLDQIFDNLITPRIFGTTLGVHPAAVLISAIILASLIGIIGLLLAAPVLASVQLFGRYIIRKMVDLPPFPDPEKDIKGPSLASLMKSLKQYWLRISERMSTLRNKKGTKRK
jgi:predicted PurR-regulated permease PerM